ncbi:ras association domain-containing protein 8 [Harmonia axyridis]|uniref:ras association domain-containing protein 8 n=1 Tax=Harmonia axyridis TaxID=115357 RepID=UPI001E275E0C|nr:ras association domain-containing protein 8 [Harmonia axyridis]
MELKVWVEGIQRIVCGVTEATTCQDVVFALAHATGKSGRFSLIERWRNNERLLAPSEYPLKILNKWGEYSNDVQLILQWNEKSIKTKSSQLNTSSPQVLNTSSSSEDSKDLSKQYSFNLSHHSSSDNIGIVKGIQQVKIPNVDVKSSYSPSPQSSPRKSNYSESEKSGSPSHRIAPPYKDPPAPPPYRDPPPPSSTVNLDKQRTNLLQNSNKSLNKYKDDSYKLQESVLYNAQYRELITLINYQRERLTNQQADLTKYDAEIVFWESKEREKQLQLEYIAQELVAITNTSKINQEQIQALSSLEEENEIVKQQEKTLKSEITLLRSKLANCETELLQCKNKMRLLMEEYQVEQRLQMRKSESRKQFEKTLLAEMERLQKDIDMAKQSTELHHLTAETLKKEVAALEAAIVEKKQQVEHLVDEMKEANLESLIAVPSEDTRQMAEGPSKAGSTRKMIGSPRQLENAVPTNKNPHGVWV